MYIVTTRDGYLYSAIHRQEIKKSRGSLRDSDPRRRDASARLRPRCVHDALAFTRLSPLQHLADVDDVCIGVSAINAGTLARSTRTYVLDDVIGSSLPHFRDRSLHPCLAGMEPLAVPFVLLSI